jgi:hypothetical protein
MFTERYLVEWLLQNSLGSMWLAMCRKRGWTADVERKGENGKSLLDCLDERRADWRAKRERGEVALDELMPIHGAQEERWKYWVRQPIPQDAIDKAPDTVKDIKLLDPACGSGHFLVIAMDLLVSLYQEEARHLGRDWPLDKIVESIVSKNLHGIDIDSNVVQIAAAALVLKAKQIGVHERLPEFKLVAPNVVAPNLSIARLDERDPARLELYESVEREVGIPRALLATLLKALQGANYLGTLLRVDAAIESALEAWEAERDKGRQPRLAQKRTARRSSVPAARTEARDLLVQRIEAFLEKHSNSADLGLRFKGEQLASGVRFVRMVAEGQYNLVGNRSRGGLSA